MYKLSLKKKHIQCLFGLLAILGLGTMLTLVLAAPARFMHDEAWYLNEVGFIHRHGFGETFFRSWFGSAGPLVGWTHWLFEPLTHLHLPGVRLVNTGCAVASILIIWRILHHNLIHYPLILAISLLAIPPIWKVAGVVYTEMPAVLFSCLSLWALSCGRQPNESYQSDNWKKQVLWGATAGIIFSFAILLSSNLFLRFSYYFLYCSQFVLMKVIQLLVLQSVLELVVFVGEGFHLIFERFDQSFKFAGQLAQLIFFQNGLRQKLFCLYKNPLLFLKTRIPRNSVKFATLASILAFIADLSLSPSPKASQTPFSFCSTRALISAADIA